MAPRLHVTVLIINCKCDVDVKLYNVLPYMYIHHECRSCMKAKNISTGTALQSVAIGAMIRLQISTDQLLTVLA